MFFCRKPGSPSYQMEARSCWTFGWATNWKVIILKWFSHRLDIIIQRIISFLLTILRTIRAHYNYWTNTVTIVTAVTALLDARGLQSGDVYHCMTDDIVIKVGHNGHKKHVCLHSSFCFQGQLVLLSILLLFSTRLSRDCVFSVNRIETTCNWQNGNLFIQKLSSAVSYIKE